MLWLMALPSWIKVALASVLVLGLLQMQHWWAVRGLRRDIATVTLALDKERTATAEFKVALADVQANRDALEAVIRRQSDAIDLLQARARQSEAAANLRVARALRAGEEAAAALRAETTRVPPGHEAMNAWLSQRVGS